MGLVVSINVLITWNMKEKLFRISFQYCDLCLYNLATFFNENFLKYITIRYVSRNIFSIV
jgi:hypothetical protein